MFSLIQLMFNTVLLKAVVAEMEGFIVNGQKASIKEFSHSVFLAVKCIYEVKRDEDWVCGGSVLNQHIVLTAAHCLEGCKGSLEIVTTVGDNLLSKGLISSAIRYRIHEHYDQATVRNDIGLVVLKSPFVLGEKIGRVIILANPPNDEEAWLAGWGLNEGGYFRLPDHLMAAKQRVWLQKDCHKTLFNFAIGCLCGNSYDKQSYPAEGDSGSALIVQSNIQIGIVSHKVPSVSRSMVVYSDVGYFYSWIKNNAKNLYCQPENLK